MTRHNDTRLHRTRVVLVASALVATALLSFAPALGTDHRDPEPTRWLDENNVPAANKFILNLTSEFHQVAPADHGAWLTGPKGSVAVNVLQDNETFWITNRSYEGIRVNLNVIAPDVPTGLFGFALNHRLPLDNVSAAYRTVILDWADANRTHNGYDSEQGFTLYFIDSAGELPDSYRDACFWAKHDCPLRSPLVPGHLEVLDNWTHGRFAPGAPVPNLGWEPGEKYNIDILYYNEDISPGSYGILVRVTGGDGHYANGRDVIDWRFTGEEPWALDYFYPQPIDKRFFTNPQPLGLYTFQQAGVEFGDPDEVTYIDEQRPKISVKQTCNVPTIGGWCPDTSTVDVTVQEDGSGIASVDCSISSPTIGLNLPDCDLATFPVDIEGAILTVVAHDHGGLKRTLERDLRIDNTPPVLSLAAECLGDIVNGWCNANVGLDKEVESISGVDHYICHKSLSGGAWETLPCMQPVAADGDYNVRVKAVSKAGLESNTEFVQFLRDASAPVGEFLSPAAGCLNIAGTSAGCTGAVTVTYGEVAIEVNAVDPTVNGVASGMDRVEFYDGDGLFATVNGGGEGGVYTTTWSPDRLGEHVIKARLVDQAGNVELIQLTVDVVIPGLF